MNTGMSLKKGDIVYVFLDSFSWVCKIDIRRRALIAESRCEDYVVARVTNGPNEDGYIGLSVLCANGAEADFRLPALSARLFANAPKYVKEAFAAVIPGLANPDFTVERLFGGHF